ncbi:MAG: hypothetical protein ABII71_04210 [Candidatus Micrarchaeota archaeon]
MALNAYIKMLRSMLPNVMKEQLKNEKGDVVLGMKYLIFGSLVVALTTFISMSIVILSAPELPSMEAAVFGILYSLVFLFATIPTLLVGSAVIGIALTYKVARTLGGKGAFADHFYHLALLSGGLAVSGGIMLLIPVLNFWLLIAQWMYSFYLAYLIYRNVHKLGQFMSGMLAAFPIVIIVLGAMFLGMGMALIGGPGSFGAY